MNRRAIDRRFAGIDRYALLSAYFEAWGRGIERILEACRIANAPVPALRYEPSGLWVEFSYPALAVRAATDPVADPVAGKVTTQETNQKTTQKTTQKILTVLARNPAYSRREIAEELGDISESRVKYHLEKVKASSRIRWHGGAKGGYWEILK